MRCPRGSVARSLVVLGSISLLATSCGNAADAGPSTDTNDGPIAQLFGWGDYDEAESNRQQLESEQVTADCMREEGFEYFPIDYSAQQSVGAGDDLEWGSPEFGEKYGYGIMRNYEEFEAEYIQDQAGGNAYVDDVLNPNDEYAETLSESERTAYYEALWGAPQEADGDGEYIQPSWEDQGCYGKGQHDVFGDNVWDSPDFSAFYEDAAQRMENDPRLLAANRDWTDCIGDTFDDFDLPAGMTVDKPESVYSVFDALKSIATGQDVLPIDPATGQPIGDFDDSNGYSSSQNADGTGWAFVGQQRPMSTDDIDRLRELELDVWKQDQACQREADLKDVRNEVEQQFVDEIRAEFPSIGEK